VANRKPAEQTQCHRVDGARVAFRLPLADLKRGIAQVVGTQRARIDEAGIDDDAILETRKSVKKLRALLALVHTERNTKRLRRADRELRTLARGLGMARDVAALSATATRLARDGLMSQRLERALQVDLATTKSRVAPPSPRALGKLTFDLKRDLRGVSLETLVDAATRSYQAARRGMSVAHAQQTSDAFHAWRKSVQRHARHLQLLAELWPLDFDMRITVAKDLARALGEEHDLHLFAAWLSERPKRDRDRAAFAALDVKIAQRQLIARTEARASGARLFAERPKALRRRLRVYARQLLTAESNG
jgi:CHAD domain